MRLWRLAILAALAAAAIPLSVHATDACEPYPVGRCGGFDRETIQFCYRTVGGRMIAATDTHVLALGTVEGVALPDNNAKGLAYLRMRPSEAFVADPYESDLPYDTLVVETNDVRGVQLAPFKCGSFIWYAECDSWMGPYSIMPTGAGLYPADSVVA